MFTRRDLLQFALAAVFAKTFPRAAQILSNVPSDQKAIMDLTEQYPAYP